MPSPPPKIAISLGGSGSSSQIKKRTRPTFSKRHRASANDQDCDDSDSDNPQSDDGRSSNKRNGRAETILTYGDDEFTSSSRPRKDNHRDRGRDRDGHRDSQRDRDRERDNHRDRNRDRDSYRDRERDSRDRWRRSHSREGPNPKPTDPEEKKPVQWGLTINPKSAPSSNNTNSRASLRKRSPLPSQRKPKSLSDEALESLLGAPSQPKKRKLNLDSETPDREPQAEDYEAVPIDDFGAALLRNFGWNGQMQGKVKEVKRHADLAGLGARNTKAGEETGTWDPKAGMHKKDTKPVRLNDYRKEEEKKRQRREDQRGHNSYRRELEREREQERERGRDR
ncbi:DExH-box splicing factor binding site-domain-containing protein [Triangularia setosa]|uniref:Pre-mRNA-splicing factor n=1 Tax=Triangularia setosa TaxID=2587417 RepID=A0AAN7A7I6_9PEZI|nr:DExH-box splicing factor binding site-domain-containing protein [Podospora setosa]